MSVTHLVTGNRPEVRTVDIRTASTERPWQLAMDAPSGGISKLGMYWYLYVHMHTTLKRNKGLGAKFYFKKQLQSLFVSK